MSAFCVIAGAILGAIMGLAVAGPVYIVGCMVTGFPADASLPTWAVLAWPLFPLAGMVGGTKVGLAAR